MSVANSNFKLRVQRGVTFYFKLRAQRGATLNPELAKGNFFTIFKS